MSAPRRSSARIRKSTLSSINSNDSSRNTGEQTSFSAVKSSKTPAKHSDMSMMPPPAPVEADATIGRVSFRPGKWRKSMSTLLKTSMCRREGACSIGGERRITMYQGPPQSNETLHDAQRLSSNTTADRPSDSHDVSVQRFVAPLSWKTVSDQRFLCPQRSKDEVMTRCGQREPISFEQALAKMEATVERKIGEGVYGEVFLCTKPNDTQSVLKLIPIEGNLPINGEKQKTFEEILSEIIISSELSDLRQQNVQFSTDGFVELRSVSCVVGEYPQRLLELWKDYNDRQGSENDSPEDFPADQLYIAFETAFGGSDLDGYRFYNAQQAFATFTQIVLALAVAEKRYDFEHRDLHTGNILIETTKVPERTYCLLGEEIVIKTHGLKATIIDYTLSRIVYSGLCLFNDLSTDEELFTAEGDYQFEIYRNMKTVLQNRWDQHAPRTNVYWLHYLLDKLTSVRNFREKTSKAHKAGMKAMKQLSDVLLQFTSVHDIVRTFFASDVLEADKEN
ncbi:serine/threonine-protein kinase haspin homolog [Anopheles arabiensis]|uniref:non-specific serine/threonine protein kinase n=1 Tax=Anopheles arabiensis TaxID=7173 RepID=A0A1Y9GLK4_ANOAR|nr:serine/threonine-protein kinase haspin homolog [Anopheles arabiensis]